MIQGMHKDVLRLYENAKVFYARNLNIFGVLLSGGVGGESWNQFSLGIEGDYVQLCRL
jgi:hypothetical protein